MKKLNIGCGNTFHQSWENIDNAPVSKAVRSLDIRKGLPYHDDEFDVCYSSHVLEHLDRNEADKFIKDIYRILKPGGIVRLVVPDLEAIVRTYNDLLDKVKSGDRSVENKYDWIMMELYDQSVRSASGGEMSKYLESCPAEMRGYIESRIGREASDHWHRAESGNKVTFISKIREKKASFAIKRLQFYLLRSILAVLGGTEAKLSFEEGWFRRSGEVHRWMYDRYSLSRLLKINGFVNSCVCRPDESRIPDFNDYKLDTIDGVIRKPDSLYIEASKPG